MGERSKSEAPSSDFGREDPRGEDEIRIRPRPLKPAREPRMSAVSCGDSGDCIIDKSQGDSHL